MQEITAQVRNNVRSNLVPFLNANAPIRNIEAKALFLRQLGYTRDQFGFSDSGVSKIEILIGNEFFRLKKMGQVEQDGWVWKVLSNQVAPAQVAPVQVAQVETSEEIVSVQEEVAPVQEEVAPVPVQEEVVQEMVISVEDAQPIEEEQVVVTLDDLINPIISNRLLSCDGYRNSLIESTPCYGNYDKSQCNGCLLAYWCNPFTTQLKADKKAERQAKRQAKSAKEALLEKYASQSETLTNLLALIGNAVEITNAAETTTYCMFNPSLPIEVGGKCMFVRNFGVICLEVYNEIKEAGLTT